MGKLTRDMTVGSPFKHIISFAIPMLLGILFQQFYNMVDTMVIGRWVGVEALAGVGSTGSINFMIVGFCNGLGMGFAIPVARAFGAKEFSALRKYVTNAVWLSIALASVITVFATVFCRDILTLMQTPSDAIDYAYDYIFIIFAGIPILYAYNMLAAIIRALGDSRSPVYFLIISATLNIILDIISVTVLDMGVMGPALATVISQAISAILCLIYMIKKFDVLKIQGDEWRIRPRRMITLATMGIPMGLQFSITAIGSVILQTSVNSLGSQIVATIASGGKLVMFFACVLDALGGTMTTYVGQNMGIGDHKRIKKGVLTAMAIGTVYSVIALGVLFFFGKPLATLFIDSGETAILGNVHTYIIIQGIFYVALSAVNIFRPSIQAMGYSPLAILAGVLEMIARTFVGFVLVPKFGFIIACFASPLAWVLADLFLVPTLFVCCNRLKKNFKNDIHP